MESDALVQFVMRSIDWIDALDEEQLFASAMCVLKELYHIESGILVFRDRTTTRIVHDPWNSQLMNGIDIDNVFNEVTGQEEPDGNPINRWLAPGELFPQLGAYGLQQVGLWKLSISQGREGVLFLARSVIHPDEPEIRACTAQLSLLLQYVSRIRRANTINQKLSSLLDLNPDAIYEIDLEARLVYANSAFERITGYSGEEVREMNARRRMVDERYLPAGVENYHKAFHGISEAYESLIRHKDGHPVDVALKKIPIVVDGDIVGFYSVGKDISEFKRIETALREAEEKYRILVEASVMGVYVVQDYKIVYANPKFCDVFGYTLGEVLGVDCRDFIDDLYKDQITKNIHDRLSGTTAKLASQVKGIRKDKAIIDIEVHGNSTMFDGRPAIVGTLIDITERKKAEALLVKSEKLAVAGELAAGLAHEIRNPLTSLRGFVQLLASREGNSQYGSIMLSELDRINQIVSEFLMVSKPQTHTMEEEDLAKLVEEVITLMQPQAIIHNVQIIEEIPNQIPTIHCNRNQLKQVAMNLIKNALESMPHGGTIYVQLKVIGGQDVFLRIRDTGVGMSKERLSKIGEPFYTTKERGTGLGLMVCYKIIANHNGEMKLYSEVDKGTTALIRLPAHPERQDH